MKRLSRIADRVAALVDSGRELKREERLHGRRLNQLATPFSTFVGLDVRRVAGRKSGGALAGGGLRNGSGELNKRILDFLVVFEMCVHESCC